MPPNLLQWIYSILTAVWGLFAQKYRKNDPIILPTPPAPEPAPQPAVSEYKAPRPDPVTIVAGVDTHGHPHGWCAGTLEERNTMYALTHDAAVSVGLDKLSSGQNPGYTLLDELLATIMGESGFNQWCINTDSLDYGLCQFSHRYYLIEYKMTAQEAIDNPIECLQIMAHNFKDPVRRTNWVAYESAGYKTRLGKRPVDIQPYR